MRHAPAQHAKPHRHTAGATKALHRMSAEKPAFLVENQRGLGKNAGFQ
jgi:hypothetical protein